MGVHCRKSKGNRGGNSSTIWNARKQQRSVENGNESMGDVINFPNRKVDEPSEADVFHTLVYRLWMREWYNMFEQGKKLKQAYLVYGHLIDLMLDLLADGKLSIEKSNEDTYYLAMHDFIWEIINENMILSFNTAKEDDENEEIDPILH